MHFILQNALSKGKISKLQQFILYNNMIAKSICFMVDLGALLVYLQGFCKSAVRKGLSGALPEHGAFPGFAVLDALDVF